MLLFLFIKKQIDASVSQIRFFSRMEAGDLRRFN